MGTIHSTLCRIDGCRYSSYHSLWGNLPIPSRQKVSKGKTKMPLRRYSNGSYHRAAGGIASTGLFEGKIQGVLELVPDEIHCKCPIIMGGKRDIQVVYDQYKKAGVDVPEL